MATATLPTIGSTVDGPRCFRLTSEQYHDMADRGWFDGKRVELVDGVIIEMSPMKSPHWAAVVLVDRVLRTIFEAENIVSVQLPLKLEDGSEPEPDLAIIPGRARDFISSLPNSASLVVEVSDTTLDYDRSEKATIYARAGVPEYWIVNIHKNNRILEVRREPISGAYRSVQTFTKEQTISPLAAPQAVIDVADLLP